MSKVIYDLIVIGGGINGAGIARDAAGRGLKVALIEAKDLAAATSSASSKLIHGGLRYLEHYEFFLVMHALQEREILMRIAPHLTHPMEFILPHEKSMRPYWMLSAGLTLYDHLARRDKIPPSSRRSMAGLGLKSEFEKGFSYYDCWTDDARLVVLNAMDAAEHGADILTYTKCTKLEEGDQGWTAHIDGPPHLIHGRAVVNAAGPWARSFLDQNQLAEINMPKIRHVKGSHIVVDRKPEGDHAYILQQPDKRIVFVIPYQKKYTLIGTTDENFEDDPYEVKISANETSYLIDAFNRSFSLPVEASQIVWDYSGVRPLLDDGHDKAQKVTRDYKLIGHENTKHPMLSVFGGKLTTYRDLSKKVVDQLTHKKSNWTAQKPLPGGDIEDMDVFLERKIKQYSDLPESLIERYARAYGTRIDRLLENGLGDHLGGDIYRAEINYLLGEEFAKTLEDILWRRTKLGLHISDETYQTLEAELS